jgi:hypothetical protein
MEAGIAGHHEIGGGQNSATSTPKQYVRPCKDSKSVFSNARKLLFQRLRLVQEC